MRIQLRCRCALFLTDITHSAIYLVPLPSRLCSSALTISVMTDFPCLRPDFAGRAFQFRVISFSDSPYPRHSATGPHCRPALLSHSVFLNPVVARPRCTSSVMPIEHHHQASVHRQRFQSAGRIIQRTSSVTDASSVTTYPGGYSDFASLPADFHRPVLLTACRAFYLARSGSS